MKIALRVLFVVVALLILLLSVPVYQEKPSVTQEVIGDVKLSKDGNRLFVHTFVHDYEFTLPPNHLREALTALTQDTSSRLPSDSIGHLKLSNMTIEPGGNASGEFHLSIGGFDSRGSGSVLSGDLRAKLSALGFSPTNQSEPGDFSPSLFMAWSTTIQGRQIVANALDLDGAVDIGFWAPYSIQVTEAFDPAVLERNRKINAVLAPLVEIKHFLLQAGFLLVMVPFGLNPLPSR